MLIWYVHGAGASSRSFAWLREQLDFPARFFHYGVDEPARSVAQRLAAQIEEDGQSAMLIGHSLGGVLALVCANALNVSRVVTICAPFGGVRPADIMALFNSHPLVQDLRFYSPLLSGLRLAHHLKPHLAIVGSHGLPFLAGDNDGAVTVASQTALIGAHYEVVELNHFEVLLSDQVASLIRSFAREVTVP